MPMRAWSWTVLALVAGCHGERAPEWAGTIDTLPTGSVVVTNPADGVWGEGSPWTVVEDLRIGAEDGTGPEVLGRIGILGEDIGGRIWAFESGEQQFKVWDANGHFIRTVGRRGGGPGEFQQAGGIGSLPDGRILVVDMQGARISMLDTAGAYLHGFPISGGFSMIPWPGRVDRQGFLYNAVPYTKGGDFSVALVRYDSAMTPLDTLQPPRWDNNNFFEHRTEGGSMRASIPFSPSLSWHLTADGDFWSVMTGEYRLTRQRGNGDTLRVVTKPFATIAVSGEEKDSAIARFKWFTDQGGKVDRGRIPDTKPPVQSFLVADDGHLWVSAVHADTSDTGRVFEIFDPEGRYLGNLRLPFTMQLYPTPVLAGDHLLAVTQDESGVPYIVRARIVKTTGDP